jgi:hypothetical protein
MQDVVPPSGGVAREEHDDPDGHQPEPAVDDGEHPRTQVGHPTGAHVALHRELEDAAHRQPEQDRSQQPGRTRAEPEHDPRRDTSSPTGGQRQGQPHGHQLQHDRQVVAHDQPGAVQLGERLLAPYADRGSGQPQHLEREVGHDREHHESERDRLDAHPHLPSA